MTNFRRSATAAAMFGFTISAAIIAGGCESKKQFAEIKGKVVYNGQPVTAGNVYVVSATDPESTGGGTLAADGTFTGTAPVGKVLLAVQTSAFRPAGPPAASAPPSSAPPGTKGSSMPAWAKSGPPPGPKGSTPPPDILLKTGKGGAGDPNAKVGKYVAIPSKYEKAADSGLSYDIKPGVNDLGTIELQGDAKKN